MGLTVLHELGHCAMALGHSNQVIGTGPNNFTATRDSTSIDDGADNVRGSRDDLPSPLPGSRTLHWYRTADNNPVTIDGTVIDENTYSRGLATLPAGSTWPASANRFVADLLGAGDDTQTVMHATASAEMFYTGITADDVNTVRYGMTGLDSQAGTADDYTISLTFTGDCMSADVEVSFAPISTPGVIGGCILQLNPIDPTMPAIGYIHHAAVPVSTAGLTRLLIQIDSDGSTLWDAVFADGFETGDLSNWSVP